jgi:predicted secreted Zn-dependent protease
MSVSHSGNVETQTQCLISIIRHWQSIEVLEPLGHQQSCRSLQAQIRRLTLEYLAFYSDDDVALIADRVAEQLVPLK